MGGAGCSTSAASKARSEGAGGAALPSSSRVAAPEPSPVTDVSCTAHDVGRCTAVSASAMVGDPEGACPVDAPGNDEACGETIAVWGWRGPELRLGSLWPRIPIGGGPVQAEPLGMCVGTGTAGCRILPRIGVKDLGEAQTVADGDLTSLLYASAELAARSVPDNRGRIDELRVFRDARRQLSETLDRLHARSSTSPLPDSSWTRTRASMCMECEETTTCLLYTSPSPRDRTRSRMPSSA